MRFASFALAPVFLATFDLSARQITVIFAAVIVPPVAVASIVVFHHLITPFSSATDSRKLLPASQP